MPGMTLSGLQSAGLENNLVLHWSSAVLRCEKGAAMFPLQVSRRAHFPGQDVE